MSGVEEGFLCWQTLIAHGCHSAVLGRGDQSAWLGREAPMKMARAKAISPNTPRYLCIPMCASVAYGTCAFISHKIDIVRISKRENMICGDCMSQLGCCCTVTRLQVAMLLFGRALPLFGVGVAQVQSRGPALCGMSRCHGAFNALKTPCISVSKSGNTLPNI